MKIGVIGLGLIGGSIFKKLSLNSKYELIGISRSVNEKNVYSDYLMLKDCDIIFVCTPMNVTLSTLDKLEEYVDEKTIVTDVCSLKGFVSKKQYKYRFIPSHPMAGTEHSGWEYSFPELFKGAKWVITPLGGIVTKEQELLEKVIIELGADIVITTPDAHDRAVALISHMPMVIAQALCENIKNDKLAQMLASSGFRDTTRLALSNTEMADDMVKLNYQNINNSIKLLNDNISKLLDGDYGAKIENIKIFRKSLY